MGEQKILTTREAAEVLRIHPTNLAAMANNAQIEAYKVGRRWRFTSEGIDAYLKSRTNKPTPT